MGPRLRLLHCCTLDIAGIGPTLVVSIELHFHRQTPFEPCRSDSFYSLCCFHGASSSSGWPDFGRHLLDILSHRLPSTLFIPLVIFHDCRFCFSCGIDCYSRPIETVRRWSDSTRIFFIRLRYRGLSARFAQGISRKFSASLRDSSQAHSYDHFHFSCRRAVCQHARPTPTYLRRF